MTFTSVRCPVFQEGECDFFEEEGVSPYCNLITVDITALVNARQSQATLQSTLNDRDGIEYEYLMLVDGMEEILDDPKQVLALGRHNEDALEKLFDEMPENEPCVRIAKMFGCKYTPGRTPKLPTDYTFSFLDEHKSPRRLKKERNRRSHWRH